MHRCTLNNELRFFIIQIFFAYFSLNRYMLSNIKFYNTFKYFDFEVGLQKHFLLKFISTK